MLPKYNQGERCRNYPPYKALLNASRHAGDKGEYQRARMLRLQAQQMPSRDPEDPDFRRLWYVRYADDFLLGFSGPRHEAKEIKWAIRQFLHDTLKLDMSTEKTLITHARTEAARFLGYEVVTLDAITKQDHRGQRCINGAVRLKIPVEVIRQQCQKYMRYGKPSHRPERLYNDDYSIVAQYQAEYRGFVQYYLMGFNAHRLWNVHRVMRKFLLGTLANKHRTTVSRIVRSLRTEVTVGDKTIAYFHERRSLNNFHRDRVITFEQIAE